MATGGRVLLLVLSVLGVSSLVGCGKAQRAPSTKVDGVIVQTEASQSEIESLFPENKVTVVNKDENLYKIQNAELSDVSARMPAAYAEEDLIFNMKNPGFDVTKADPIQEKIYQLGCVKPSPNDPVTAEIILDSKPNFLAYLTVAVGSADVILSAKTQVGVAAEGGSVWDPLKDLFGGGSNNAVDSNYSVNWIVEGAPGSKTATESSSKKIAITPDRPGGYLAVLIVQNKATKGCAIEGANLGATENKKFTGGTGTPGTYSSQKFFHVPLVNGEEAWEVTQGQGVTIAIIDSGVNYNHPDLASNIKVNKAEIPGNGVDDDNNGYVDDAYGYDFAIGDAFPYDDESHGTHVAGLAASSVSGIAKKAKILPVKAMLPSGMGSTSSLVSAIYYSIKQKADIINLSLGGEGQTSPLLLAAIRKAQEQGILIVAASGNSKQNADVVPTHLTARDGTNVLSIAATDESDTLTNYSNYGAMSVDLAAPGGTRDRPLQSTYAQLDLGDMYIGYPGTSMATPVTAGVAALVKSVNKNLKAEQIKSILMKTGRTSTALQGKIISAKVVDAAAAVQQAQALNAPLLGAY